MSAFLVLCMSSGQALAADGPSEEAKATYLSKCASCHSIGEGVRVGPDLAGAHERRDGGWLARFIKAPSTMLDSDATARALVTEFKGVRMPDLGLQDAQVQGLVDLIRICSSQKCDLKGKLTPVASATKADAEMGRKIFVGEQPQKSGGPACISCHTAAGASSLVAGGVLAKDLTNVFARLGDDALDAALANPTYPLMNKVFADKPLTKEEIFSLRAYLFQANRGALSDVGNAAGNPWAVPVVGAIIAVFAIVILNAFWSRRLRGVRVPLVQKRGA